MARTIYRLSSGQPAKEWCKENNVSYDTLVNYLNKGLLVDDACLMAKKVKGSRKTLTYYGKPLIKMFSNSAYTAIMRHIRISHCSIKKAIDTYNYNVTHKHTITPHNLRAVVDLKTNKEYQSIIDCAKAFNVCTYTIRYRIEKGLLCYKDQLNKRKD